MIAAFDKFTNGTEELQTMIQSIDAEAKIVVLGDNSFSAHEVVSLYDYFIYSQNKELLEEKGLHFNFLNVPSFWEIRAEIRTDGWHGTIYDMNCKKADIYFAEYPYVQRVEWCMEDSWIYRIDYYNNYGLKYASEFLDVDRNVESKVFYSSGNQEVIVEQAQNNTVTLLERGKVKAFFTSYVEFIEYFWKEIGLEEKPILFVQGQEGLRLSGLQSGGKSMWECVLFLDSELLERYISMGGKNGHRFYSIPEEYPMNGAKGEALILTGSDQLEGIEYLVHELSEVTFHIAANTQVSDKLFKLGEQPNVKVYPQISRRDLDALWEQCDFYLDINHYWEIHKAISTAYQKNLLILGFENTLHCRELTAEACIFSPSEKQKLVSSMKELVNHPDLVQERLKKQQAKKLEIWENLMGMIRHKSENA